MLSMWPLIGLYDQIGEIKPQDNYEIDDIVVFKQVDLLVAHRIIYISKSNHDTAYITQGDNNQQSDQLIKKSQILGKVISLKHKNKVIKIENFYRNQSKNYLTEYTKFSREASKLGLPYIILKGLPIYLKYASYPRNYIYDLDLLNHPKDVGKVITIAKNLGYQIPKDYLSHSEFDLVKIVDDLPLSLDIHLEPAVAFTKFPTFNRLIPEMKKLEENLWQNSRHHFLSPNYQYLYLLLHLFHHSYQGTKRWDLIAQVEKSRSINPKKCKVIMDQLQIHGYIYPILTLMKKYYANNVTSLKIHTLLKPKNSVSIISKLILGFKKPWSQSPQLINRLELLLYIIAISPLSLFKKTKILFHSIISLDFKRSKNWITSSLA